MSCQHCGCDAARCGCCDGITTMTPVTIENRPGLPALSYRVGTRGRFLASMKARLPLIEVVAPGSDGQTMTAFRPLQTLTTRDAADPAIAMLDAWATVADVLTFYQERIANEGYVRTATERRSLVELSRLVGYAPRPGVSSSVYLSYTVDDNQDKPVEIAIGTRAQSIPGPGETPQSFETSEALFARREWNDLQVRQQRPQRITLNKTFGNTRLAGTIATANSVVIAGTDSGIQPGDQLLFRFGSDAQEAVDWIRKVIKIEPDFAGKRSKITLQPLPWLVITALPLLDTLVIKLEPGAGRDTGAARALDHARQLLDTVRLGLYPPPIRWATLISDGSGNEDSEAITLIEVFGKAIETLSKDQTTVPTPCATPDSFVTDLLKPPLLQAANTLQLRRDLGSAFSKGADLQPQLLVDLAPRLKDSYYSAWRGSLPPPPPTTPPMPLQDVFVLRDGELLFGATSNKQPVFDSGSNNNPRLLPVEDWPEWEYAVDETASNAFLARTDPLLAADDLILVQHPSSETLSNGSSLPYACQILRATAVFTSPRTAYGNSADATMIEFGAPAWRAVTGGKDARLTIEALRKTRVYVQKQRLELVNETIDAEVNGDIVELAPLHEALSSGRWVIFDGERSDIDGVTGVRVSELLMIAGLTHGYDPSLPGDTPHTTLRLATSTAYRYKRDTLRIHANVLPASHGETRREVLGSGDGSQALQSFALRQPPLTWRPAPTAAGASSTLKLLVNDVEWREVESLAGIGADARVFVTRTGDDGRTSATFGNGRNGLRLPTGFENVRAEYRSGIGKGGNVTAKQISLMIDRPLGVKEVINPVRASGGADRETMDLIRDNAPRSIIALDRLVSVSDYADFTRMYAGIAKADAVRLSDGLRELVHITIAGVDDIAIDPDSDLYRNLLASLRTLGDPGLTVQVSLRERITLVLQAKIRLRDGYRWEPVSTAVRTRLLDRFGFAQRVLARPVLLCELIAAIQSVPGVDWVDVDSFGGIPEKIVPAGSTQGVLITQDQITHAVQAILGAVETQTGSKHSAVPPQRIDANRAVLAGGIVRPAQLAMFAPAVSDTLILNQI